MDDLDVTKLTEREEEIAELAIDHYQRNTAVPKNKWMEARRLIRFREKQLLVFLPNNERNRIATRLLRCLDTMLREGACADLENYYVKE